MFGTFLDQTTVTSHRGYMDWFKKKRANTREMLKVRTCSDQVMLSNLAILAKHISAKHWGSRPLLIWKLSGQLVYQDGTIKELTL